MLDKYREQVIQHCRGSEWYIPISRALATHRHVFNGIGKKLASDVLYHIECPPHIALFYVMKDNDLFNQLKATLCNYLQIFCGKRYLDLFAAEKNLNRPFYFDEYLSKKYYEVEWTPVFRKATTRVEAAKFVSMYNKGLFDENHQFGE